MQKQFCLSVVRAIFCGVILCACLFVHADEYALNLEGKRIWAGPDCWAKPMQYWSVHDGELRSQAAKNVTCSLMACEIAPAANFRVSASIRLSGQPGDPKKVRGGWLLGTRGAVPDWRSRALEPQAGIMAGVRADGFLFVGKDISMHSLPMRKPIKLEASYDVSKQLLTIRGQTGATSVAHAVDVKPDVLKGGIALLSDGPKRRPVTQQDTVVGWQYHDVRAIGDGIKVYADRTFGPILWSQYTLSRRVLKLSAQMPPMGARDADMVTLEVQRDGGWQRIASSKIEPDARIAVFRINDWDDTKPTPYRVGYRWRDRVHIWSGTVRANPVNQPTFSLAAFTGDYGYAFPVPRIVAEVKRRNPDLLFFSGDQLYERYGGHSITRKPIDVAMVDYLRKWYQFGWTWREVLKDRPMVAILDDHDVFQGNLFGMNGKPTPKGKTFDWGGYVMVPRWVNMAQRTQTAHLPDPVDPKPLPTGIDVYFTALDYGGGRLAVIEDRKFKSGKGDLQAAWRAGHPKDDSLTSLDFPGGTILGERQHRFLEDWVAGASTGAFNAVLSQTMFAQVQTHSGPKLRRSRRDRDTNAWPQTPRNEALRILRRAKPVLICGDQHFGALVRLGIDDYGDGPITFMTTGTSNGWPRACWPGIEESDPAEANVDPRGKRLDAFGHPVEVLAAANPEPRSNTRKHADVQAKARAKGSGFGLVTFNKQQKTITFDMLRYPAQDDQPADCFPGFPLTLPMQR